MTKVARTHIPMSIAPGPTGTQEPDKPQASLQSVSQHQLPPEIENAFAHLARPHGGANVVAGDGLALRPPDAGAVPVGYPWEFRNGRPPMPIALASGKVSS